MTNVPLDQICLALANAQMVHPSAILRNGRGSAVSRVRGLSICLARHAGWRPADLGKEFGLKPGTIAYHPDRFKDTFQTETGRRLLPDLRKLIGEQL